MVAQIKPRMGGVAPLVHQGVGPALRESALIQRGAGQLADLARAGMNQAQELEQIRGTADLNVRYSDWYTKATEKPVVTTSEAMALGAADAPNLWDEDDEGNIIERDDINLWEFLPDVAKAKYDQMTQAVSRRISGGGNRDEWVARRQEAGASMYEKMKMDQADNLYKESVRRHDLAIQVAQDRGDWGMAVALAESHPIPEKRDEMVITAVRGQEIASYHEDMLSGDVSRMQESIDDLRNPDTLSNLPVEMRTAWVGQLTNQIKRVEAENTTKRTFELDQTLAAIEGAVRTGEAGKADIRAYSNWLYETGNESYVSKGWIGEMDKIIDRRDAELLEQEQYRNSAIMAMQGQGVVDTTDSKQRDAIDAMATQFIINGEEDNLFRLARGTNYLSKPLANALNGAMNLEMAPQQVQFASNIYNKLLVEAPNVVKDIPEDTAAFLKMVGNLNQAGENTEETIQSLRTMFSNTDPDVISYRTVKHSQLAGSGKLETDFTDRFRSDGRFQSFLQLYNPFGNPKTQVADEMYLAYEDQVEFAMLRGMTPDEAMEYAYGKVSSAYSTTEINGGPQVMRNAPETAYNIPSEYLRDDYSYWLGDEFGIPEEERENYVLKSTMRTQLESQPTYQVYKKDPDTNMLMPEHDQHGIPVRWKPDVKGMQERQQKAQMEAAKKEREMYERGEKFNAIGSMEIVQDDMSDLATQIRRDEGFRGESYMDTEGHLTGGVGHKLSAAEKEKYPEGTPIPEEVTRRWFRQDLKKAEYGAKKLLKEHGIESADPELKNIITNMVFQMGEQGVRDFKKMWANIKVKNTEGARAEMKDSKWYGQTQARADRLIARMNLG